MKTNVKYTVFANVEDDELELLSCDECGAFIADDRKDVHTKFHEKLDIASSQAADVGMWGYPAMGDY